MQLLMPTMKYQKVNVKHFDVVTDGEAGVPSEIQTVMGTTEGKDCIAMAASSCSTILAFSHHVNIVDNIHVDTA
jgi:hypothetical protein